MNLFLIKKIKNDNNIYQIDINYSKTKNKICLKLDIPNNFDLNILINEMNKNFIKFNNKNQYIGDEHDFILFITKFCKNLHLNKFNNMIEDNKFKMIKIICLSKMKDNEKYNQIVKLSNQKIELRNIIYDSSLNDIEKYNSIYNLSNIKLNEKKHLNNFGKENYIGENNLNQILKSDSFIDILDKYIQLIHFNKKYYENNNIIITNKSIKIFENNNWVKNNDKNIQKILNNTIMNLYELIYKITMENILDSFIYAKGLLTLNKINKLLVLK